MNHFENFLKVFELEIESLTYCLKNLTNNIDSLVDEIITLDGKLIVTGIGKSGHIGRKIAATLASTGTESFFMHATEAFHGDLGMINSRDALLCISFSGETDEVLKVLHYALKNDILTISITGNEKSTLATRSTYHLNSIILKEACNLNLAPTSSTTNTLVMGDALAVSLMKARGFKEKDFARYHPGGSLGKRLLYTAGDFMKDFKLPILSKNDEIIDVIFEISSKGFGLGLVVENKKLIGIITDGDLRRALGKDKSLSSIKTKNIINSNFKSVFVTDSLDKVKNIMQENKILSLPVTNTENNVLGIIQYYDL